MRKLTEALEELDIAANQLNLLTYLLHRLRLDTLRQHSLLLTIFAAWINRIDDWLYKHQRCWLSDTTNRQCACAIRHCCPGVCSPPGWRQLSCCILPPHLACDDLQRPVTAVLQGGYLGKAQGWTNRVTNNLQGQAEHLKGKFAGSVATVSQLIKRAQACSPNMNNLLQAHSRPVFSLFTIRVTVQGQGSTTGTGLNTTGTRTGYEPTGTGTGYSSSTGTGTTGYSDPNSGYSTGGNQPGVAHGHNAHLSQGYAPAQANSGTAADGTYGHTAQVWSASCCCDSLSCVMTGNQQPHASVHG